VVQSRTAVSVSVALEGTCGLAIGKPQVQCTTGGRVPVDPLGFLVCRPRGGSDVCCDRDSVEGSDLGHLVKGTHSLTVGGVAHAALKGVHGLTMHKPDIQHTYKVPVNLLGSIPVCRPRVSGIVCHGLSDVDGVEVSG
jgi:hypothetical protein